MNKRKHNIKALKSIRKELRDSLAPAEAFLWNYLQGRRLEGRKFRRQHSIENYIVDFYCLEEKLVIELDGEVHNTPNQIDYDRVRDEILESLGNIVLRFENRMVFENLESVLEKIKDNFG